jgi:hypothetical protein
LKERIGAAVFVRGVQAPYQSIRRVLGALCMDKRRNEKTSRGK